MSNHRVAACDPQIAARLYAERVRHEAEVLRIVVLEPLDRLAKLVHPPLPPSPRNRAEKRARRAR